jgi:IS30 family transposase
MKKRKKLTKEERTKLFKMRRLDYSARAIASALERRHTTILRELKRNASAIDPNADYFTQAQRCQEAAHQRRSTASAKKMRLKCEEIRSFVEVRLKVSQWSPEIIAGRLGRFGYRISAEAIYQYINIERPELKSSLLIAGRSRRRRIAGKRHRKHIQKAAPKRSIEELPKAAKDRTEIGHLELDALHGKQGGAVLQVKVDRYARKIFLDRAATLQSEPYADILIERVLKDIPEGILKTILEDNGSEHADHQRVDTALNVLTHFCHPYCASERGTVENRNKALRRFFPKGVDIAEISQDFIEWVEDYMNNTPMKVLAFKTPNEVWAEKLAA